MDLLSLCMMTALAHGQAIIVAPEPLAAPIISSAPFVAPPLQPGPQFPNQAPSFPSMSPAGTATGGTTPPGRSPGTTPPSSRPGTTPPRGP